jgi:hypothetical protein
MLELRSDFSCHSDDDDDNDGDDDDEDDDAMVLSSRWFFRADWREDYYPLQSRYQSILGMTMTLDAFPSGPGF